MRAELSTNSGGSGNSRWPSSQLWTGSGSDRSRVDAHNAAVAAVQGWRFQPGKIAGQPVGSLAQVPIVFSLQDDSSSWL